MKCFEEKMSFSDGSEVGVVFCKSRRAKYYRVSVRADGVVRVTVPRRGSYEVGREFLVSKAGWVRKHLAKFGEVRKVGGDSGEVIDRGRAREGLVLRLEELAREYGFAYNRVFVRNQKTRWGSCSGANNISLNVNLVRLPAELRDYVILHELVHTRVKNHSKRFWAEMEKYVCGAKGVDKRLKGYGIIV